MMSSTSSLSFVATLAYDGMLPSSLSSKNLDLATSVSIPKRSGFVASESFASTLNTLVNTSTSTGSVGLIAFALALRAADADAAAREDPRDAFATSDSFASFDSVCTLESDPSITQMTAVEFALLVSVYSFPSPPKSMLMSISRSP
jgi:hypothetical protein